MSAHHVPWGIDLELLDPEAWDCPSQLTADACMEETGCDRRRAGIFLDDPEADT